MIIPVMSSLSRATTSLHDRTTSECHSAVIAGRNIDAVTILETLHKKLVATSVSIFQGILVLVTFAEYLPIQFHSTTSNELTGIDQCCDA